MTGGGCVTLVFFYFQFVTPKRDEACLETDTVSGFLQIKAVGFESNKEMKILWTFATLAILWVIWLERNDKIFKDRSFLLDKVVFMASLWAKAMGAFPRTSLVDL